MTIADAERIVSQPGWMPSNQSGERKLPPPTEPES
jgi:hypothetical protein